jgi:signal peptidase II
MAEEETAKRPSPANSRGRGIALFSWPVLVVIGCYLLDQLTKWWVVRVIPLMESRRLCSFFALVHFRNTGAAWSILSDYTWLLGLVSVVAFALIAVLFRWWNNGSRLRAFAVALLLGGIAGNMTDRIFRGNVVDFLDFHLGEYHWPAFNVADSAICVSIAMLFVIDFLQKRQQK